MIYEHRLNCATRGLISGPHIIQVFDAGSPSASIAKGSLKREFFVNDKVSLYRGFNHFVNYKVEVRARDGGEILWARPFGTYHEAAFVYLRLIGLDIEEISKSGRQWRCPPRWLDGDLEYIFTNVTTFNSTLNDSTKDWLNGGTKCPVGVTTTSYLAVGGGGGGGVSGGGGAGSGGFQTGTGHAVTPGTNYPVVIGGGGSGGGSGVNANGSNGTDTTWDTVTANAGGGGGGATTTGPNTTGNGNGGGAARGQAAGTMGTGNAGGTSTAGGSGGGGGANQVGANSASNNGAAGGNGTANTITGSSVTYAGGGGGGLNTATGGTLGGAGGSGGGGTAPNTPVASGNGTDNLGGGGSGSTTDGGTFPAGGNGGKGVVILSFNQLLFFGSPDTSRFQRIKILAY